ncbi:hypothetical protein CDAR_414141 [Caerostris darwini]|uniref:Uncharacterized protein n=1 Tax=Caerostris darwini TaxID=1538125 RepID=A0AAV4RH43_9ARAC|nr:hypothetical protein CDAR_414141 [Caerostris darwini]
MVEISVKYPRLARTLNTPTREIFSIKPPEPTFQVHFFLPSPLKTIQTLKSEIRMMFSLSKVLFVVALVCVTLSCYEARPADDDAAADAGTTPGDDAGTTAGDAGTSGTPDPSGSTASPDASSDGSTPDSIVAEAEAVAKAEARK